MKTYRIALLPGDGIGPDVVAEATRVLRVVAPFLEYEELSVGAREYLVSGDPLPSRVFERLREFPRGGGLPPGTRPDRHRRGTAPRTGSPARPASTLTCRRANSATKSAAAARSTDSANPVIRGEETGQVFFRFESGASAVWDANRHNEVESPSPRYTFGQMRIDDMGGHLTLDTEANLRVKPLGQPGRDLDYPHRNVNFGGDCVYALQRHVVDCLQSGAEFEANGEDYLKTLRVVDAVYESAARGQAVRL